MLVTVEDAVSDVRLYVLFLLSMGLIILDNLLRHNIW